LARTTPDPHSTLERIEFVDLAKLHREIRGELEAAIRRVCERSAFIGGAEVAGFEEEWASFTGARYAIGVANGTDAIELVLTACSLPAGSEVVVPANTFIATAEAVVTAGHRVRFVDVEPDSGLIDLGALARALEDGAAAVIAVHLYGRMVDMDAVLSLARQHGALVIEDAAQSHAARRAGRHSGTLGLAGAFSFYPGKNLGALGDAGAVVTDDEELAATVRLLRDHGRGGHDNHVVVGVNSRLDGLQAAVLRAKLPHLERWTIARRAVAQAYRQLLEPDLLDWAGAEDPGSESHHLFPILVDQRDEISVALGERGIATGVHYRVPCHQTPAFAVEDEFPVAEDRARRQLSLPIHSHLSPRDIDRVIAELSACLRPVRAAS
jgi:dTDP-4-amino-4,6-dideoxygalactose transaminase